ncbi:MAG: hypothetical protein ACODAA_04320 [Gemmatimonadota bacterium]
MGPITRRIIASLSLLFVVGVSSAAAQEDRQEISDRALAAESPEMVERTGIIVPGIEAHRFAETAQEPALWYDVVWVGRDLEKTATEVRGDLLFYDLTGKLRFGLAVDLQRPISRNDAITQTGIGIRYDDGREDHRWLRSTPLSSMLIDFRVKRILYDDGELVEY